MANQGQVPNNYARVAWQDHAFTPGEWNGEPCIENFVSIGYLVYEDDEVLVLAQSRGDGGHYHEYLTILRATVVGVTPLFI